MRARALQLGIVVLYGLLTACAGGSPATRPAQPPPACTDATFGSHASLALDAVKLRGSGASDALLAQLAASSYHYFRTLGPQFALRTCAAFRDVRWHLPLTAIHGDAHVEQFVITADTSGLADFDQSGYGAAVVDLVRYAASLHLTCREVSWPCDAEAAAAAYLESYRAAIAEPPMRVAPSIAARLRGSAPKTTVAWLQWADSLMRPLPPAQQAKVRSGWREFRRLQRQIRPERAAAFFEIVRMGGLRLGVGSALEAKLLLRIRGATDHPDDDQLVEMRLSPAPSANACAWRPPHGGSIQPLLFMAILGQRMPDIFGVVTLFDEPDMPQFWVQSWEPGYRELSIADLSSQQQLVELAQDAARQLAGHFWSRFPEPLRAVQRHAQLDAFDRVRDRARVLARRLAAETVQEWIEFRATIAARHAE